VRKSYSQANFRREPHFNHGAQAVVISQRAVQNVNCGPEVEQEFSFEDILRLVLSANKRDLPWIRLEN